MFGSNKRRRRRRSEMRLGTKTVNYESTAAWPGLSLTPILKFWQQRGSKISGMLVFGLLMWAGYTIFVSPAFYVYGAEIRGNYAVSAREIYSVSQIDSQSVFWLNPARASQYITQLPNIKSAEVSIDLPSRVVIEVVERRPQLLWQVDDQIWWVDQEGTIVPPRTEVEDMLKIIDDDRQPVKVGYQIDPTIIKGAQALRILAPDVSVIKHTRAQGLIVATPEGWPVYLGDGSQMRAKLIVLSELVVNLRKSNTSPVYIDIRNPLRPVYKELPVIRIEPPRQPAPAQRFPPPPAPQFFGRP